MEASAREADRPGAGDDRRPGSDRRHCGHRLGRPVRPLTWILAACGTAVAAAGLAILAWTIGLFDRVGKGTLSPFDPPSVLVVTDPYRHIRNPMFLGVLVILLGETIAAPSASLLAWLVLFILRISVAVPSIEEPRLARKFGDDYTRYRQHLPRWIPRARPWTPPTVTVPRDNP